MTQATKLLGARAYLAINCDPMNELAIQYPVSTNILPVLENQKVCKRIILFEAPLQ